MRPMLRALLAVAALIAGSGCGLEPTGGLTLRRGATLIDAAATPPAPDDPRWRDVTLPDRWERDRRVHGTAGWYRLHFDLPGRPDELWAVSLPLVVQNAAVWVNGEPVGDGGPFAPTLARNWNRPLLFTVPPPLLSPGANTLVIRLASAGVAPPVLAPVHVGPERLLHPPYALRMALQVGIARTTTVVGVVLIGLLALLLRHREYFVAGWWFLMALALLTATSIDGFVRHPGMPVPVWDWCVTMARIAALACIVAGTHRHLGLVRPGVERVAWTFCAASGLLLAMVPPLWTMAATLGVYVLAALLAAYTIGAFVRHRRQTASRVSIGFVAVGAACLAFAVHDVLTIAGVRLLPLLLVPYAFTVVVVTEAGVVTARLVQAWGGLLALNRDLESRVRAKSAELEDTWARVRDLERERIVAAERQRITRDIHDGLGGHLVTTLAMLESEDEFSRDDVAEALRGALDDLRLVIDSLDPRETDLVGVLATIRSRLEPRLRRRGLQFRWDVGDLPPEAAGGPEQLLRVLRVVQEAITNVLKHAQATTITVRTGTANGCAWVAVADDGRGFALDRVEGRGLVNMRRRAAELGGRLTIDTGATGTTVTLQLG